MAMKETFTFRLGNEDRKMLVEVADELGRSKGDAIRFLIRTTARLQKGRPSAVQTGSDAR